MKISNLKINKKKLTSILLAFNILLSNRFVNAEIISYEQKTTLDNVYEIFLHYIDKENDELKALITFGKQVGYVPASKVNYSNLIPKEQFKLKDECLKTIKACYLYAMPEENMDYMIMQVNIGTDVNVFSISNDGWYGVTINNTYAGFIHKDYLNIKMTMVKVTGNGVNIRSEAGLKSNIIGSANQYDSFELIDEYSDWYKINYHGTIAYISKKYSEKQIIEKDIIGKVSMAKVTDNNVNIRSGPDKKYDILGFSDITDSFEIIGETNDWYKIKYLNQEAYISKEYTKKISVDSKTIQYKDVVYLTKEAMFYRDLVGNMFLYLPRYQYALIIEEEGGYYKVNVDGVIGYINKKDTKKLSKRCIIVDLSRQILKVYSNGKEVFRAKIISGAKSNETNMGLTNIGCFNINRRMKNYTFPNSGIFNEIWMPFDGNRGFHPADKGSNAGMGWQEKEYFEKAVSDAYKNWARGNGKTYPQEHGSGGCINMKLVDIEILYDLINSGDDVLIIGPNDLIKFGLISEIHDYDIKANLETFQEDTVKVKKLV